MILDIERKDKKREFNIMEQLLTIKRKIQAKLKVAQISTDTLLRYFVKLYQNNKQIYHSIVKNISMELEIKSIKSFKTQI